MSVLQEVFCDFFAKCSANRMAYSFNGRKAREALEGFEA